MVITTVLNRLKEFLNYHQHVTFINNIKTRQNTKTKFSLNKLWPEGSGLFLKTKQKYKYLHNVNRKQHTELCSSTSILPSLWSTITELGNTLLQKSRILISFPKTHSSGQNWLYETATHYVCKFFSLLNYNMLKGRDLISYLFYTTYKAANKNSWWQCLRNRLVWALVRNRSVFRFLVGIF